MTQTQTITKGISQEVEEISEQIITWRRYLHANPEASLKEYKTAAYIKQELDKLNVPYRSIGETGVLAEIQGGQGSGKTILLRADIDALELNDDKNVSYKSQNQGLNHACGHDGHTASLLGAVKVLKDNQANFKGTIRFAFQQAEEIGAGARIFVDEGALENVDTVFGIHLDSSVEVGKLVSVSGATNASCDIIKIQIQGKSTHIASPHLGSSALLTAVSIINEAQKLVAANVDPTENALIGFGVLNSGTRYNIVPNQATIEGTLRAFSFESRQKLLDALENLAKATAQLQGTQVEIDIYDAAAPLINDSSYAQFGAQVAAGIVGAQNVIQQKEKSFGADDFADFLAVAPGVYARVGTRNLDNEATHFAHHHNQFDIDERSLLLAAQYHINYALTFLENE